MQTPGSRPPEIAAILSGAPLTRGVTWAVGFRLHEYGCARLGVRASMEAVTAHSLTPPVFPAGDGGHRPLRGPTLSRASAATQRQVVGEDYLVRSPKFQITAALVPHAAKVRLAPGRAGLLDSFEGL